MKHVRFAPLIGALSLAWNIAATAQNADLQIEGSVAYERTGDRVLLTADRLCNRSSGGRSGTVYIGLFATTSSSPVGQGYVIAETGLQSGASDRAQLDGGTCFSGVRFTTDWAQPPNGVYYVHFYVTEYPNNDQGPQPFRLLDTVTLSSLLTVGNPPPPPPPRGDDHGNSTGTATVIALGTAATPSRTNGILESAGDIDVFRFSVTAATPVVLRTESAIDTVGELRDSAGVLIARNDDGTTGLDFVIEATLSPGTFYLTVSGFEGAVTGPYVLLASPAATPSPPGNRAPTAEFTTSASQGSVPFTVTFNAFSSRDTDGSIVSYSWDFGDGSIPGVGMGATHTYQTPGTYTAALTVTDNNGARGTTTRQITATSTGGGGGGRSGENGGGGSSGGGGAVEPTWLMIFLSTLLLALRRRHASDRQSRPTRTES